MNEMGVKLEEREHKQVKTRDGFFQRDFIKKHIKWMEIKENHPPREVMRNLEALAAGFCHLKTSKAFYFYTTGLLLINSNLKY